MTKIKNIFTFLKEFNELSNPVISEISKHKWSLNLSTIPNIAEIKPNFHNVLPQSFYLEVTRPTIEQCPTLPALLEGWVKSTWKNANVKQVEVIEKVTKKHFDENKKIVVTEEFFSSSEQRVLALESWKIERNQWISGESSKVKGLDLYNKLFTLHSEIKKSAESVELILGDGLLRWNVDNRMINHPVVLQKVSLDFNPSKPSFTISSYENHNVELYGSLLRSIPSINQNIIAEKIRSLTEESFELYKDDRTAKLINSLINIIDKKGEISTEKNEISGIAKIYSEPTLFLRKRNLGFASFIEETIADIESNPEQPIPGFFNTLTGDYSDVATNSDVWNNITAASNTLLTLPSNNEQLKIISTLNSNDAVIVQGPPGTGKTHTIANLIGHLLSEGKSVLVSSHTEKALTVLKDKIYKDPNNVDLNLQKLCIRLLSSTSHNDEMDESINEIADRSTSIDLHLSDEKIARLRMERAELIQQLQAHSKKLIRAHHAECEKASYNDGFFTQIDAGKFLQKGTGLYDYFTGASKHPTVGMPLRREELEFLYSSTELVSPEDEKLLFKPLPSLNNMFSSEDFEAIINEIVNLQSISMQDEKNVTVTISIEEISQLFPNVKKLLTKIDMLSEIEKAILNKALGDKMYIEIWNSVLKKVKQFQTSYIEYRGLALEDTIEIDDDFINSQSLSTVQEIIQSGKDKPIGRFFVKNDWKQIRDAILINGQKIELRKDFINAQKTIAFKIEKKETAKQVAGLLSEVVDVNSELVSSTMMNPSQVEHAITFYELECEKYIDNIGSTIIFDNETNHYLPSKVQSFDMLIDTLKAYCQILHFKLVETKLNHHKEELRKYYDSLSQFKEREVLVKLVNAVKDQDAKRYAEEFDKLSKLLEKHEIVKKRVQLFKRIQAIAPSIATQIASREGIHNSSTPPDYFMEAWKHFQFRNQLEMIERHDIEGIQVKIDELNARILQNARALAVEKAWFEKVKNQTDRQNQALQGWRSTIKQIGKGTGKNAPLLKAKAKELIPECQSAIPVWIMPLNSVFETFHPAKNKFDVIIIDEASQANILSLAALYLAKKVVIVGDDEQVSPDAVGIGTDEVNNLANAHLINIPNNHLFNPQTSLYDLAKTAGFKPTMLTEHFRSLPDIIEFSNSLSYNGRIKPLRESSATSISPAVVEYPVENATRSGNKVNELEANHIVSIIQDMITNKAYDGQTIGVISMLGNEQSAVIEKKLQSAIDPIEFEARKIQCGTPSQFQGDERDVIIMTLVDSPNENGTTLRLMSSDGNNNRYKKRYNVAASRARNQLWVVHSLNPNVDLKHDDLRLQMINYTRKQGQIDNHTSQICITPFVTELFEQLETRGYSAVQDYKAGAYNIDIVVSFNNNKVAIECVSHEPTSEYLLEGELRKKAILKELGWNFIRLKGSDYYQNPEAAIERILSKLHEFGVSPASGVHIYQ